MELPLEAVKRAEQHLGVPREVSVAEEFLPWEMDLVERVCGDRRFHDLTTFVVNRNRLALVHKPSEPEGVYWAPSGGLDEGEELEEGVRREVEEETGLRVEVERYLLRVNAVFTSGERSRPWTSHLFLARPCPPIDAHLHPQDTKEVESASWIALDQFRRETAVLLARTGWGRFRYRLRLAGHAFAELGLPILPKIDGFSS
jgi:ADP-ribose pyrophosphatase YjhB (NUDIX family)